jgi:hypothetical protein
MGQFKCSWKGAADIHFVLAHCRGISIKVEERRMGWRKPFCPSTGGCGNAGNEVEMETEGWILYATGLETLGKNQGGFQASTVST